jgi:hypothetical protein
MEGSIIPMEVKAALNLKAKSLKTYMEYYKPQFAIRTSLAPLSRNGNLAGKPAEKPAVSPLDILLYLVGQMDRILQIY